MQTLSFALLFVSPRLSVSLHFSVSFFYYPVQYFVDFNQSNQLKICIHTYKQVHRYLWFIVLTYIQT